MLILLLEYISLKQKYLLNYKTLQILIFMVKNYFLQCEIFNEDFCDVRKKFKESCMHYFFHLFICMYL